ncbi:hypothetical protein H5410_027443 [Solanum commersonii]|uniref:Uncharacterized protein n=1 Tax=Solanum commersonii TaxID=4109 RepID=A0A9J5Z206_SOLCO|nr:hypothetical protein H5410_027443 [Solanum commersonii]
MICGGHYDPSWLSWEWLRLEVFGLHKLRLLHDPSQESWSSPLAVKWLMKMSHFWAALDGTLPHHHKWAHDA